jgi:alpha-galactosidase
LKIALTFQSTDASAISIVTTLVNNSAKEIPLWYVSPFSTQQVVSDIPLDRTLIEGQLTWTQAALLKKDLNATSTSCVAFSNQEGKKALFLGFTDVSDALYELDVKTENEQIKALTAKCNREYIPLKPGQSLKISPLKISTDKSLSKLMDNYADDLVSNMGQREPKKSVTNWSSWYYYYTHPEPEYIYANMDFIANNPELKERIDVFQLDDGWFQTEPDQLDETFGDYESGYRYPDGMKKFADDIKERGMTPGLWVAPFKIGTQSKLYNNHPEYMVQRGDKATNILDVTNPDSKKYVSELFNKLIKEWGFEYLKIDFIGATLIPRDNTKYTKVDPTITTVQAYREAIGLIRKTVGEETYLLGCGAPITNSVGLFDGMRIGHDISSIWFVDYEKDPKRDFGFISVKLGANQTIWRNWMQRKFWQNDPDCLVVRDYGSSFEIERHEKLFPWTKDIPKGLSYEEAKLWSDITWFTGGVNALSTDLERLKKQSPDRYELLLKSMPVNEIPSKWIDWYVDPELVVMESQEEGKYMLAMFNLSDDEKSVSIPRDLSSLEQSEWSFKERILEDGFEGAGNTIKFPSMPPHASRIWILE